MYDFYLGSPEEISNNEIQYLISIKRMMPRWINSIPETEFVLLAKILDKKCKKLNGAEKPVFVETGVGASSLVFVFYAMKYNGLIISWDINAEKGSLIKTVCNETMCNYFSKQIDNYWKFIASDSLSKYLGLPILNQLVDRVDIFFHDAEHVWFSIKKELESVIPLLKDGSIIALDDANLTFQGTNEGYINTFRKKIGLPKVNYFEDNICEPFYIETEKLLKDNWDNVEILYNSAKEELSNDPFSIYFSSEPVLNLNSKKKVEENKGYYFFSWQVSNRIYK